MNCHKSHACSAKGFTLIELMIVVIIVAVLMGVALPAYQNQVLRSNRAAAKSEMLEIAVRQKQFLLANRAYVDRDTLEANGYTLDPDVGKKYDYAIELSTASLPSYTLTFTPLPDTPQQKDGALSINSEGVKTPSDKWLR